MKYKYIIQEKNKLSYFLRFTIFACFLLILFHISCLRFLINKIKYIENLSINGLEKFKELDDELRDQFSNYYFINQNYITRKRRQFLAKCECNNTTTCPKGLPGIKGLDGIPGFPGEKGPVGEPGKAFEEIITTTKKVIDDCRKCPFGAPGIPGEIGLPGPPGLPGTPGFEGMEGRPGEVGIIGMIGEQGPPGIPGTTGEKGFKGTDGVRGVQGLRGLPGSKGQTGKKGEPGYSGFTGKPGSPGEKGQLGPPGIDGMPGMLGQHGIPGMTGEVGNDGGYCKCQSSMAKKTNEKEEYNQKQPYVKDETFTDHTPLSIGIAAKIKNIKIGKTTKKTLKFSETDDDKKYDLSR